MQRFFPWLWPNRSAHLLLPPPLSLGSCYFLAALIISFWALAFPFSSDDLLRWSVLGWFWVEFSWRWNAGLLPCKCRFRYWDSDATGIVRWLEWPQPPQAWQRPLGWFYKGHWDGSAKTTGIALQARICVLGPGSANPLDRWQSIGFFAFELRYGCTPNKEIAKTVIFLIKTENQWSVSFFKLLIYH